MMELANRVYPDHKLSHLDLHRLQKYTFWSAMFKEYFSLRVLMVDIASLYKVTS